MLPGQDPPGAQMPSNATVPQASHRGSIQEHGEHQRLRAYPKVTGQRPFTLLAPSPPLQSVVAQEGEGSWFQGWRTGTESCHPWTKVTVWLSWVFLNTSSSLNCSKLCVRETSAERGGKDGLNLDPISEAGPGLGWAGESGKGEPGPEQWVGLGSS